MSIPVTALGQCGFRFQLGDAVVYTDPYLTDHVAEVEGDSMRRMLPIPVQPSQVTDADFVLVTHAHMDHCDLETLVPLSKASAQCRFVCPNEVSQMMIEAGIDAGRIIVAGDQWIELGTEARVMAVPSAHPQVEKDVHGCYRCLGYVIEYQGRRLYHAGDGSPDDLVFDVLSAHYPIHVAFIPVNERNYYRDKLGIVGNMSVREAFQMAEDIGVEILVPTHWDMFALNNVFREELELMYELIGPSFDMKLNPESL